MVALTGTLKLPIPCGHNSDPARCFDTPRERSRTLKPDTDPLRCYVGQIQSVDALGIRVTLVDWIIGEALRWDLFVPRGNIESMLLATEEHDLKQFGDAAGKWQTKMEEKESE